MAKPAVVYGNELAAMEESIEKAIAYRAYELFQRRGNSHGRDLEDWFQAESELIKPTNLRIDDSEQQISLRAEVPGFTAEDIQIGVALRRLIIWGQARKKDGAGSREVVQMLGEVELPSTVDPKKTVATVSNGILDIRAAKEIPSAA